VPLGDGRWLPVLFTPAPRAPSVSSILYLPADNDTAASVQAVQQKLAELA
jgi:hypothetical protein